MNNEQKILDLISILDNCNNKELEQLALRIEALKAAREDDVDNKLAFYGIERATLKVVNSNS